MSGEQVGLPLVETFGAFQSHSASRNSWHSHPRFELLFLLEGATAYEFSNGRTVELPGGHFLIVPPGAAHRGLHDVRMPASLCGIVFDPRRKHASRNTPFTARDLEWMACQFDRGRLTVHAMGSELRRLASSLHRELRGKAAGRDDSLALPSIRLLACAVILESARALTAAEQVQSREASASVLAHMEQHYAEELNVDDLARQAGCGRASFFQTFKRSTGLTPNDYLQRLRVNKAKSLLNSSDESITEIAFAVGFSSSQYFCNVFRKYTSQTPSTFRRRRSMVSPASR